jgi:Mn-dependent DtxR family transcriptional regulator
MKYTTHSVWKEFDENKVTHSITHYLFAIDSLLKENWYARAVDIAKQLDITAGSCSIWIKWLVKKELIIEDENKFIKLSSQGEEIIKEIKKTRNAFKKFFVKTLWIDEKIATINACKIEHLIDSKITKKLEKFIKE